MTGADVELAREVLAGVRAELGEDLARVRAVRVDVKPRPDAQDIKRGCIPTQMAAFYGVGCEQGTPGATELPDPRDAEGEIILFLDNLQPLTRGRLRVALLHEYAHALGHDEETILCLGLYLEEGAPDRCSPF